MMSDRNSKQMNERQKLKEMIQEKDPDESVEKVLVKFCMRRGVSLKTCRQYYKYLVASGEIDAP
jgi:hypothetical protein